MECGSQIEAGIENVLYLQSDLGVRNWVVDTEEESDGKQIIYNIQHKAIRIVKSGGSKEEVKKEVISKLEGSVEVVIGEKYELYRSQESEVDMIYIEELNEMLNKLLQEEKLLREDKENMYFIEVGFSEYFGGKCQEEGTEVIVVMDGDKEVMEFIDVYEGDDISLKPEFDRSEPFKPEDIQFAMSFVISMYMRGIGIKKVKEEGGIGETCYQMKGYLDRWFRDFKYYDGKENRNKKRK